MSRTLMSCPSRTLLCTCAIALSPMLSGADRTPATTGNPLRVVADAHDFSANPKLLARLVATPHGYFRFINVPFSNEVCRRFPEAAASAPPVNLHGDAHVEQFAVTDLGRGLTDFDDTCVGPAVLDLVRFGVSLHLTCRQRGWQERSDEMVSSFLGAYRDSLTNPERDAPEPVMAQRLRSSFSTDRGEFLDWADSQMSPVAAGEQQALVSSMGPYVQSILAKSPTMSRRFFSVTRAGRLQGGIGSALDLKYLVRVAGESASPDDDVVLELKEVRDISGISCIDPRQKANPLRVLLGQARLAHQPFQYLGHFRHKGQLFWAHAWVQNFKQVRIDKSVEKPHELAELAADVGVQLGRGHVRHIAAPFDAELRQEQLNLLSAVERQVRDQSSELADLTEDAWNQFKKAAVRE